MKKKLFLMTLLLGVVLVLPGMFVANCIAEDSALEQLQDAEENSSEAANDTNLEDAKADSGVTFDTPDQDPPPVDLSGAGDHPTPQLLRNPDGSNPYAPKE